MLNAETTLDLETPADAVDAVTLRNKIVNIAQEIRDAEKEAKDLKAGIAENLKRLKRELADSLKELDKLNSF